MTTNGEMMVPPSDKELETTTIGAILMTPSLIEIAKESNISAGTFYTTANGAAFAAMLQLQAKGEPIDFGTVSKEIKQKGEFVLSFNPSESHTTPMRFLSACKRLKRYESTRKTIHALKDALTRLLSGGDFQEETANIEIMFAHIASEQTVLDMRSIEEVKESFLSDLHAKFELGEDGRIPGIPINIKTVDQFLGGWQAPKLTILAARPGMGKTEFAIKAANESCKEGFPAAIITMEMNDTGIFSRAVSHQTGILKQDIERGTDNAKQQIENIKAASEQIAESGLMIDEKCPNNVNELIARCAMMVRKGAKFIVIDYLGLVPIIGKNDNKGLGEITRQLKLRICKELKTPVLLLHQLSRAVESRPDKMPILSDLRGSGEIEQDADNVLFLMRPEYYGIEVDEEGNSTIGLMWLIIAKQRGGATGKIPLRYVPSIGSICEWVPDMKPVSSLGNSRSWRDNQW